MSFPLHNSSPPNYSNNNSTHSGERDDSVHSLPGKHMNLEGRRQERYPSTTEEDTSSDEEYYYAGSPPDSDTPSQDSPFANISPSYAYAGGAVPPRPGSLYPSPAPLIKAGGPPSRPQAQPSLKEPQSNLTLAVQHLLDAASAPSPHPSLESGGSPTLSAVAVAGSPSSFAPPSPGVQARVQKKATGFAGAPKKPLINESGQKKLLPILTRFRSRITQGLYKEGNYDLIDFLDRKHLGVGLNPSIRAKIKEKSEAAFQQIKDVSLLELSFNLTPSALENYCFRRAVKSKAAQEANQDRLYDPVSLQILARIQAFERNVDAESERVWDEKIRHFLQSVFRDPKTDPDIKAYLKERFPHIEG